MGNKNWQPRRICLSFNKKEGMQSASLPINKRKVLWFPKKHNWRGIQSMHERESTTLKDHYSTNPNSNCPLPSLKSWRPASPSKKSKYVKPCMHVSLKPKCFYLKHLLLRNFKTLKYFNLFIIKIISTVHWNSSLFFLNIIEACIINYFFLRYSRVNIQIKYRQKSNKYLLYCFLIRIELSSL